MDDRPAEEPAFGFDRLAEVLTGTLRRQRAGAFVLGIHGPWGSGKTTLLDAIARRLREPTAIVIEFNAWKYDEREALWRALILRVLEAVRGHGGDPVRIESLQHSLYERFTVTEKGPLEVNWTAATATAIQITIGLAAAGVGGGALAGIAGFFSKLFGQKTDAQGKADDTGKQIERIAGILQRTSTNHAVQQVVSIEQFVATVRDVIEQLPPEKRIYILVDDLDRCLPESSLGVFEAIKLFLDSPRCAYVVAVDRRVIRAGLEVRYPRPQTAPARATPPTVDPDEYIEKAITLSLDLPMLSDADGGALLGDVESPTPLRAGEVRDVVFALGANPRRLKRFAAMLAMWDQVAQAVTAEGASLAFNPADPAHRPLFIKLSLIGYVNSALIGEMRRDAGLAARLQEIANAHFDRGLPKPGTATAIAQALDGELPVVAQAGLEPALWRTFCLEPRLTTEQERLPGALRWFRSAA